MEQLYISVEDDAPAEDLAYIRNSVDEYNIQVTGDPRFKHINVLLRHANGALKGGALGDMWGEWMHLTFLWVAEEYRHEGYGTLLLTEAERQATAWGCRGVYLETFSFQARPFYERHGYTVFGTLPNFPAGQQFYFLYKHL